MAYYRKGGAGPKKKYPNDGKQRDERGYVVPPKEAEEGEPVPGWNDDQIYASDWVTKVNGVLVSDHKRNRANNQIRKGHETLPIVRVR